LLLPLSALAFDYDLNDHAGVLRKWVISRSFGLRFDAAANTRIVEEYALLRQVLRMEAVLGAPPARSNVLRQATRRTHGALWRGFLCVLALAGARDVGTGVELDLGDEEEVVVFSALPRQGTTDADRFDMRVLGMLVGERSTALMARRAGFASVLAPDILNETDVALASQLLPPAHELVALMRNPEELFRERLVRLDDWLREWADQEIEM
jgi:hypothetical protein